MEPSDWQPIETAPKDGNPILCCDARTGEIKVAIRKLFFAKSRAYEWFRDDEVVPGHTWSLTPTHWMPLPELPAAHLAKEQEQESQNAL